MFCRHGWQVSTDQAELARRIMAAHGEWTPRKLELGYSNEVWQGENLVLRLGQGDVLRREARLVRLLHSTVGYPHIVAEGAAGQWEWLVAERIPGDNLRVVWTELDGQAQLAATIDMWQRLRLLRTVDLAQVAAIGCPRSPFYALDPPSGYDLVRRVVARGRLTPVAGDQVMRVLAAFYPLLNGVPRQLVHSDAGPGNTVWDGRRAIPLDFEFATVAPGDLELEGVFRTLHELDPGSPATQWMHDLVSTATATRG